MSSNSEFKFKVICVGLARTGTTSLSLALNELLPGKVIDFKFYGFNPNETNRILEDKNVSDKELEKYFQDHNLIAALQFPIYTKYKRLLNVFPDAKVILTVRDPENWVKSMEMTSCIIKESYRKFPCNLYFFFTNMLNIQTQFTKFVYYYITEKVHYEMEQAVNCGKGLEYYNTWLNEIKKTVPNDRLLIYNIKEGWAPLCKFLEVPIPCNTCFPIVNKKEVFFEKRTSRVRWIIISSWILVLVLLLVPIALGLMLMKIDF